MNKPILYVFDESGILQEIEEDTKKMKQIIRKYENYTKRIAEKVQGDSTKA